MSLKTQNRYQILQEIRGNGDIGATPYSCSGTAAHFNVSFPTFQEAFTFVKFARRSSRATVIRMRETPEDTALNARAMVRIRVDEGEPAEELQTLLEVASSDENVGV